MICGPEIVRRPFHLLSLPMTPVSEYVQRLNRRYFSEGLPPEFLRGLEHLPLNRADVRGFIERAFALMVAGEFAPRDLSSLQGEILGSLVARILPGGWQGHVPPITVSGRHREIDRYLANCSWRPGGAPGRLLDVGCGFPPFTTVETAEALPGWTVHGIDPSLPACVLYDEHENYATFDAKRKIVYFQPAAPSAENWTALLADAAATRARFASLFAKLARRAPVALARGKTIVAHGAKLVPQPLRGYERAGLAFSIGGIGSSLRTRYDVVRCFNVLMYFDDTFRSHALAWFAGVLEERGILLTGSNWAFSTESRYFVFQKQHGKLHAREFAFSIDNLCPVAILPWYTTVDDDRELATLTPLLRTLRSNGRFKRRLDEVVDALRLKHGICARNGNGCYGGIDPSRPAHEIWTAAAQISASINDAGLVDAAIRVLQRAGHSVRRNEIGHVAVALDSSGAPK